MIRRPPRSTRTDTLFPYTTLFRAAYTSSRNYGQDTPDPNNPAQIPADYDIANRFSTLKGYGLFNGRITANLDNGIELSVWGRNLTNTKYNQNLFNSYTGLGFVTQFQGNPRTYGRSEEHTSELQTLMRISYAV